MDFQFEIARAKCMRQLQREHQAAYKRKKWVRCTKCLGSKLINLYRKPRLRDRLSPCCNARMHPLNWRGFR